MQPPPVPQPSTQHPSPPQPASWQDIDWREHQRWVALRGGPVNVIELGEGPAMLFIHGLGGSWQNWLEQLPVFAASRRAVAFDLPGFGHSPMPSGPISMAGYVRAVQELLDALGIAQAAVVGNSMGGLIAGELAATAPARVSHLALISPAGVPVASRQQRLWALRALYLAAAPVAGWIAAHADAVSRRPRLRAQLLATVAHQPECIGAPLAAEQLRGIATPGFRPAMEDIVFHSLSDRLGAISCPTLIVWGHHDHVLPVYHAELFADAIPAARKVVYEDAAHVAMFERPAEVNALLAELLAEAPPDRAGRASPAAPPPAPIPS